MKNILLIVFIAAVANPLFAHQVDVITRRTLDDKALKPDSIRVECAELGIQFTTTDTLFTLSDPTSVHTDNDSHASFGPANIYDVTGRLLAQTESSPSVIGLSWINQYGLVYVVPMSTSNTSAVKGRAEISSVVEVTLTLWRAGYDSAKTVFEFPTNDTTVNVLLELLPWWKRIHHVNLIVHVPLTAYSYIRNSSENGGTTTSDSKPRAFTFYASTGVPVDPDYAMPTAWILSDSTARYYYEYAAPHSGGGFNTGGFFVVDTSNGEVDSLQIGGTRVFTPTYESGSIVVHDLPRWDSVSSNLLELLVIDSLANLSLVAVDSSFKEINTSAHPSWTVEINARNHVATDSGITIRCRVFLKD